MITGKTKNLGVIGWPIAHSFSPNMHNAAIAEAGLDYTYMAMPVKPEDLKEAVAGVRALGFKGINVTIPHKQAIMEFLDEIHDDARIIGAVNTVVNEDGRLIGYNTDIDGFINALKATGFDCKDKKVVMLGAGGAARAVIWGFIKEGISRLTIAVRNVPKVLPLAESFSSYLDIKVINWIDKEYSDALKECELLVNTTPLGMYPKIEAMPPVDFDALNPSAFVYDIIYTPAETMLLRKARENGLRTLNGEGMLAGQGAVAFKHWTGVEPDINVMAEALRKALKS